MIDSKKTSFLSNSFTSISFHIFFSMMSFYLPSIWSIAFCASSLYLNTTNAKQDALATQTSTKLPKRWKAFRTSFSAMPGLNSAIWTRNSVGRSSLLSRSERGERDRERERERWDIGVSLRDRGICETKICFLVENLSKPSWSKKREYFFKKDQMRMKGRERETIITIFCLTSSE